MRTSPWRRKSRSAAAGSQLQFSVTAPPLVVAVVKLTAPEAISAERSTLAGSVVEPLSFATPSPVTEAVRVSPTSASLAVKVPLIAAMSCAFASAASATAAGSLSAVMTGAWFTGVMSSAALAATGAAMPSLTV